MKRRSPTEIRDRLTQELANLWLWFQPAVPALPAQPHPLPLPSAAAMRAQLAGTPEAAELVALAHKIASGHLPVFGQWVAFPPDIPWRRDWVHGKEWPAQYFRLVPYLDFSRVGDHKYIWEINRHQHLVTLAQAWVVAGDPAWLRLIESHLESWWTANPPQCGINWASALEVAFRALSWLWVLHLVGPELPAPLRAKFNASLYFHGRHLARNLSHYFSPNTHLLGEAVVLHALGTWFAHDPWLQLGHRVVDQCLDRQLLPDGAYFEQSTYYHVYALDMFLFHAILHGERSPRWQERLAAMADYLRALARPGDPMPLLGDDDGGRFFHPHGDRQRFGEATLSRHAQWAGQPGASPAAAWWLPPVAPTTAPPPHSRFFPTAGLLALHHHETSLLFDGGNFGALSSGHSHADSLSLTLTHQGHEVLIDPGTFTYMGAERNTFRSTSVHNTVTVGPGQAEPRNPFAWQTKPLTHVDHVHLDGPALRVSARCEYRGLVHRRRLLWDQPGQRLWILDQLSDPAPFEQTWHLPAAPVEQAGGYLLEAGVRLTLANTASLTEATRSRVYGTAEPSWLLRQSAGSYAAAVLTLDGQTEPLSIHPEADAIRLRFGPHVTVWPNDGTAPTIAP